MKKTIKEMVEVMLAFDEGKRIEIFNLGKWVRISDPKWDWADYDYRIEENNGTKE